jgi:magnesium transporter
MVAGIYGMNFEFMPELGWKLSYPLLLVSLASMSGYLFYKFRKSKWL